MSRSAAPALSYSTSTTTLITLPPSRDELNLLPPPTKNTLTLAERARLMRSTKKIGALLGTTPHFTDSPLRSPYSSYSCTHSRSSSSTSLLSIGQSAQARAEDERERIREKRKRRQGSVFEVVSSDLGSVEVVTVDLPRRSTDSVSSTSTSSSFQSLRKTKERVKPPPQPLVLCLQTRSVEAYQEGDVSSLPCTPTTATVLGDSIKISTPLSSTTSHHPATPILPTSPNNRTPNSRPSFTPLTASSTSESPLIFAPISTPDTPPSVSQQPAELPSAPMTPSSARPPSPSALQSRRKKMAKLAKQFGENVPAELVFPSERDQRAQRRRSRSFDSPSYSVTVDVSVAFSSESWVGEWNRDIKDVQKGLRALRLQ